MARYQTATERAIGSRMATKNAVARELLFAGILARFWPDKAFWTDPIKPQLELSGLLCIDTPAGRIVWRLSADELEGFKDWLPYRENDGKPAEDKLAVLHALAFDGWAA